MKLEILSIVLDGEPFIERHLPIFEGLKPGWFWRIAEGVADNVNCTSWCQKQKPRLSSDGTTEYLDSIAKHERVKLYRKKLWDGKIAMFNKMISDIKEPSILLTVDVDELWRAEQLELIVKLFEQHQTLSSIMFTCRYFVGEKLILEGRNCYGDHEYEWLRAFRFNPSQRFSSHEPPVLTGDDPKRRMSKEDSRKLGLVFDHFAYATEAQAAYKEQFYGYPGLVNQWLAMQHYADFPAPLSRFFSHVTGDQPKVVRV
jgi:hypothetical protein